MANYTLKYTGSEVDSALSTVLEDGVVTNAVLDGNTLVLTCSAGNPLIIDLPTSSGSGTSSGTTSDDYVVSGSVSNSVLTLTRNSGTKVNITLPTASEGTDPTTSDDYVVSASVNNGVLTLTRYLGGTVSVALPASSGDGTSTDSGATTLAGLGITATSTELNVLDGITATTTELNYVDGVTKNIQTQLNEKLAASKIKYGTMSNRPDSGTNGDIYFVIGS